MTVRPRAARASLAALLAACAACGAPPAAGPQCATSADCAGPAHCVQGACIADVPPVAQFAAPASVGTNLRIQLVSTSTDADDAIVSHVWTITPGAGACDPDPATGDAASLETIFFCPGEYEIALVAIDAAGAESAPRRATVQVVATPGAPAVTAGPAIEVAHRCAGTPLRCVAASGADETVQLGATASDPDGDPLAWEWTAFPPPVPAGAASPAARFVSGATSYAPVVAIESDGGPIAGAWRFRVRVTDATGLVAQAVQLVQVGNAPPQIVPGTAAPLPHRYDAGTYRATGELPFAVVDPDGDPTAAAVAVVEPGATCTSSGTPVATGASVSVACAAPADLIGPARVARIVASDPNGGQAVADLPVAIGNRPPVVRAAGADPAPALLWFDHGVRAYDGVERFFASDASPFVAEDPDGDPVAAPALRAVVDPSRPFSTARVWTDGTGTTRFELTTPLHSPQEFRSADGRTGFTLEGSASDPWTSSAALRIPVAIRNRPPGLEPLAATVAVPHRYDAAQGAYLASARLGPFSDPDGDPVTAGPAAAAAGPCVAEGAGTSLDVRCAVAYLPASGPPALAQLVGLREAPAAISDPWEAATGAARVEIGNRAPSTWDQSFTWTSFYCETRWWVNDGPLPVSFADPDGDPAAVSVLGFAMQTLLPPGGELFGVPASDATSLPVTVSDGVASASATMAVTYAWPTEICKAPPPDPPPPGT